MPPDSRLVELPVHSDARGELISVEAMRQVPFPIERVYYIVSRGSAPRGFHAHKQLRQLLVCIAGSCRVVLDDGVTRTDYPLDRPELGLTIEPMVWHEMHDFAPGTVLLVLASARFDEADYIRDYDDFRRAAARP